MTGALNSIDDGGLFTAGSTAGTYTITASSGAVSGTVDVMVVSVASTITTRALFYHDSAYDSGSADPGVADDNAIDLTKIALRPGQAATAANYSGYAGGIDGIIIDIAGSRGVQFV